MIWVFGDSFSTTWEKLSGLGKKYIEWKGYTPKIFSDYLAAMLNTDVAQLGVGG